MLGSIEQTDNDDVHIQAQIAMLTERTRSLVSIVDRHEGSMVGIYNRLQNIERLIYIGLGGLLMLSGLATFFGWNILKMLGR